jgi:hypothetical protein
MSHRTPEFWFSEILTPDEVVFLQELYIRASGDVDNIALVSGGNFNILTATGDVDDSNLVFTFVSEPTLVVVNGTAYRHGHGVTISTTTATLDNPPGVGGDVYGLGA